MALRMLGDLIGTLKNIFRIGGWAGVALKESSGNLAVRSGDDSADAEITAAKVNVSGDSVDINSDAAGAGDDWKYTLTRPATGMTADVELVLPVDDGTAGQVLQTDGDGNLAWVSAGSTAMAVKVDSTAVAFGDSSPITMFTLPADAVVHLVRVIVDTAFDGTGPAQLTVGYNGGSASAYMTATENDLTAEAVYDVVPAVAPDASTRAMEVTYSAASGGSAGAARVEVHYSVPT